MLSIVIPALNESLALPRTLNRLFEQPGSFEVIVVDGGSTDDTLAIAGKWPSVRIVQSEPGRASQMNAGASIATGELLLFLHADTLLPEKAIDLFNQLESDSDVQWGGFHQQFSGDAWPLRLISWMHNLRCRLTRVFYGDQAMFVRRDLFNSSGGFPDIDMLEDVKISERLLAYCEPVFFDEAVVADSRKFEQMGSWRSLGRCILIILCNELHLPIPGKRFFAPIR